MNGNKVASIIMIVFILLILIVYVIVIFESYKRSKFIFAPFNQQLPNGAFYPLGAVYPLTQEEIQTRNAIINGQSYYFP